MPNRVVALFPAGTGPAAARRASEAVHAAWQGWVSQVFRPADEAVLPGTPGFPCVQWVCVPPDPAGYAVQWDQAQADPLVPERRIGLARDDRRVRAGYLYQSTHLRPEEDWAFLAEYTWPGERGQNPIPFGGKGRLADIEPAAMSWPARADTGSA
jgi:CRISPR-associated protein (Cas_Cmr3)